MLITNASITAGHVTDLRISNGHIHELGERLAPRRDEVLLDAMGCALLPGLHDHHMHLLALAAAQNSVDCQGSMEELAQKLSARQAQQPDAIRGINYHPGNQALLDRDDLDRLCPAVPLRIQHQSGRLWILNSAALAQIRADDVDLPAGAERDTSGRPSGRFYHLDEWLREQLPATPPELGAVSRQLAACGVTGLTDAGPDNDDSTAELLLAAQQRGELLQDVLLMGRFELSEPGTARLRRGAHKLYLKESRLPELDHLCRWIGRTHQAQRPVAFHCVTRVELQFALLALREAGVHPGDRIEHASVCGDEELEQIRQLNLTVVTQPHFIHERGERYRQQVDVDEQPLLYRARAFTDRGIALAAGTDAPFGHYDPWRSMRAAVERTTRKGSLMGGAECLEAEQALALYTGDCLDPGRRQRKLSVGAQADLCLLDCDWPSLLADLDCRHVRQVWRAGEEIFRR